MAASLWRPSCRQQLRLTGDCNIVMTSDCFETSGFLLPSSPVVWDVDFVTGARVGAALDDFFEDFATEILRSVGTASCRTTEAPPRPKGRRGRISGSAPAPGIADSTAPVAAECQSFLDNVVAGFRPIGSCENQRARRLIVTWGLIPREGFGDLLRDPFRRWVSRDIAPHKLPPIQPDNHQNVKLDKADGWQQGREGTAEGAEPANGAGDRSVRIVTFREEGLRIAMTFVFRCKVMKWSDKINSPSTLGWNCRGPHALGRRVRGSSLPAVAHFRKPWPQRLVFRIYRAVGRALVAFWPEHFAQASSAD